MEAGTRYWIPQRFYVQELVPRSIYEKYGMNSLIWLDARIIWTLDQIRKYYDKPITVNNWHEGGPFDQRGFRDDPALIEKTPDTQHRFGRAMDFDIQGITAEEHRENVQAGKLETQMIYVTRIELAVSWNHHDVASVSGTNITYFRAAP
jgi:hypothetical protein